MEKRTDLGSALEKCLEALEREQWSLKECLEQYPDHKEELSTLLGKYSYLQSLPKENPRSKFRKKSHQQLLNLIQAQQLSQEPGYKRSAWLQKKLSPVQIIAAAVLAFFLVSSGVAYAADAAVPGDRLYRLDRALEQIRLRMTVNEANAAALYLRFAEERLEELEELVGAGDIDHALEAVENYGSEISALAEFVGGPEGFDQHAHEDLVNAAFTKHIEVLNEVMKKVPEKAQQAIQNAIDKQNKVPGYLKDNGRPEDAGRPEDPGKPEKTEKPEKTKEPDDQDD